MENFSKRVSPASGSFSAPENCRYHAVSKVIGFTDPLAHPCGRPTQIVAHGVGVPSDQIISEGKPWGQIWS